MIEGPVGPAKRITSHFHPELVAFPNVGGDAFEIFHPQPPNDRGVAIVTGLRKNDFANPILPSSVFMMRT